jgi:hypothetical protein
MKKAQAACDRAHLFEDKTGCNTYGMDKFTTSRFPFAYPAISESIILSLVRTAGSTNQHLIENLQHSRAVSLEREPALPQEALSATVCFTKNAH